MKHIITDRQFIVQTKVFSEVFPDFPNENTLKVYLYICRNYDWKVEAMHTAKTVIQSDLNISYRELTRVLNWLENNHFIQRSNSNNHQMYQTKILIAPDFDVRTNRYIGYSEPINTSKLKQLREGYASVPNDVLSNAYLSKASIGNAWKEDKIRTLVMLYRYCWLEYFGGVNPDIITLNSSGKVTGIDPSFYYSLKMTETEVIRNINYLIYDGLFQPVKVWFEKKYHQHTYMGDYDCINPSSYSSALFVLRPKYISKSKIKKIDKLIGEGKIGFDKY